MVKFVHNESFQFATVNLRHDLPGCFHRNAIFWVSRGLFRVQGERPALFRPRKGKMEDGCFPCNQGERSISEAGGTCMCALWWQSILFVQCLRTCSRMTTTCCQLVVWHGNYIFISYSVVNATFLCFPPSSKPIFLQAEENTFAILTESSCK